MLLLYSIVVTLVLFGIYHYLEKRNSDDTDVKEYNIYNELLTFKNIIVVSIIFIFIFSLLYVAFDDGSALSALGIFDNEYTNLNILNKSNILDKDLLKKCNEPMKAGFEPYNSNSSASSSASSSVASSDSSDISSSED